MFLANKLNKGAGSPAALDAQFNYVTMLLHGDGTNGAQNNTFLDSSTNNFTITRNGNTTQGSFSPYGSNWSNNFPTTSGDYLTIANNAAFTLGNTFTVECWLFRTASDDGTIVGRWYAGNASAWLMHIYSGGKLAFGLGSGSYNNASASTIPLNTWTHLAVSNDTTSKRFYINGVLDATFSSDNCNSLGSINLTICQNTGGGYGIPSYISNLRIVKGTAVYTSNFTPSTAPLTAISGTSLLTCQSNRFIDNSTNNFTITPSGSPSVQRFNPFGASTAYSTSVIGGSGYFDGSGDYLNTPSTSQFTASGDFTVSCWFYLQSFANSYYVVGGNWNSATSDEWLIQIANDGSIRFLTTASTSFSATGLVKLNQWTYFTTTRSGTTVTVQLNGTTASTYTKSDTLGAASKPINIGQQVGGSWPFNGYISDFRLLSGSAITTVPTAPVSSTSTGLLLSFTNGAIFDNAMMNDLETVGNAQISTSVKKYGTGSLKFDGTNNCCLTTQSAMSSSGPFTFECWAYWNDTGASTDMGMLCSQYASGQSGRMLFGSQSGALVLRVNGGTVYLTTSVSTGTWYFVAWTFDGTTHRLFLDGVLASSSTSVPALYTGVNTSIGGQPDSLLIDYCLDGYMDEVRITKGVARYTTTFTPPTQAFPNIGPI